MIEANPRMWGPIQFALDNGLDLFGGLWRDAFGTDAPKLSPMAAPGCGTYYFWSGGLVRDSQPYTFHNFNSDRFLEEYAAITSCDLLNRFDTRTLYHHELKLGTR
jgi:hypothetical protein